MVNARQKAAKNTESDVAAETTEKKPRKPRVVRTKEQKFNDDFNESLKRRDEKRKQLAPLEAKLEKLRMEVKALDLAIETTVASAAIFGIELVVPESESDKDSEVESDEAVSELDTQAEVTDEDAELPAEVTTVAYDEDGESL